ncbi:PRC-barrel domain containing protein [Kitasatospora sp. NBC_00240]|uniref:PRC-barrel domain containing protein n=1 Tax=Kitasatospora sp. NBC_00240 TaxID=2903567 RepID=UPI0022559CAB|nr:PRC-barrel domain containing protein [Kitasatospora sp. NBC_00240]MCX5207975.1 PRC-barrel domain containing protein [Kitasatospora sp. NBC_00240]
MSENLWEHRAETGYLTGTDLAGYRVEAIDGHIGKVDKHTADAGAAGVVVDTGVWIFGREVLLPAGCISSVDTDTGTVYLNRTKQDVKDAPEFLRERHDGDSDYRTHLGEYYYGRTML